MILANNIIAISSNPELEVNLLYGMQLEEEGYIRVIRHDYCIKP